MTFRNLACREYKFETDTILREELAYAGIPPVEGYDEDLILNMTMDSEVKTKVIAFWNLWKFQRAWIYWVCTSNYGLPFNYALPLHLQYGKVVRVDGDCSCPSPETRLGLGIGCYHVDTLEGLKSFADTLRKVVEDSKFPKVVYDKVGVVYNLWRHEDDKAIYLDDGGLVGTTAILRNTTSGVRYLEKLDGGDNLAAKEY